MKKDRTNQRGQALAYFGIFGLVFFSLAAVAVDVGRHVFVGREAQAVADAAALAGTEALARGGDATVAATSFASAAVAVRWIKLVRDQRPKMLLSVKLGVVRTALDGQPPTAKVPPSQLPT